MGENQTRMWSTQLFLIKYVKLSKLFTQVSVSLKKSCRYNRKFDSKCVTVEFLDNPPFPNLSDRDEVFRDQMVHHFQEEDIFLSSFHKNQVEILQFFLLPRNYILHPYGDFVKVLSQFDFDLLVLILQFENQFHLEIHYNFSFL